MIITGLRRSLHASQRIAIYVDSKYTFSVPESIIADEGIYIGKEITSKELDDLRERSEHQELKNKVANYISIRPRASSEIRQYLAKKTNRKDLDNLILDLTESGLIDDRKFASWWVDQRRTFTSKSTKEIKKELFAKGIDEEIMNEALRAEEFEDSDMEAVRKLVEKKKLFLSHKNLTEEELSLKINQFLQRKGFDWDTIRKARD